MEYIQQLAQNAIQVLANHRHKIIFFADCPECQLKKYIKEIHDEATKQPDPDRSI